MKEHHKKCLFAKNQNLIAIWGWDIGPVTLRWLHTSVNQKVIKAVTLLKSHLQIAIRLIFGNTLVLVGLRYCETTKERAANPKKLQLNSYHSCKHHQVHSFVPGFHTQFTIVLCFHDDKPRDSKLAVNHCNTNRFIWIASGLFWSAPSLCEK